MKIMAVDFGDVRTGIAVCDKTEFLASPVGVIEERKFEVCADKICHLASEYEVGEIVLGYPKNMNGSIGPKALKCEQLAELLKEKSGLPVTLWDERRTTVSAHNILNETNTRGKKRKAVVDSVSAVLILEGYLSYRKKKAL